MTAQLLQDPGARVAITRTDPAERGSGLAELGDAALAMRGDDPTEAILSG